ncbi:MAG: DUF87 domain-containing protein [Phycisphaerales bacterium]
MAISAAEYEKLGVFYLGAEVGPSGKPDGPLLLYKSSHLTTHAVCVGMTGSGKTGLCVALLEEAAIDGVPAIVIDPKGDLGNLLLTFPDLSAASFSGWVNPREAQTAGQSVEQFGAAQAAAWSKGLGEWGEDGERIRRLKEAAEFAIYTPGSTAGRPLAILKGLGVPARAVLDDAELMRDRVSSTASALLALVGVKTDPMKSREHILLCNIVYLAWSAGENLDLGALVQRVQSPPFKRVGAMDLESFYPAKERFELASSINGLLASPAFAGWSQGEPLDVQRLLYTDAGKPRVSVLSISHLDDAQRMFFVSLLMNEVLAWTRMQSGTTSLRAIVYMDEIAGYFPPVANPPSKQPMLTLMKQARAFGVGMVLATQNPVDIDYKGLANAGTWFIGRLQTEQDKARVLDGLEGAAANAGSGFSRVEADKVLSGLGKRQFLLNDVAESHPVVFQSRWTMSYLRGPLSRDEIRKLCGGAGGKSANPFGADSGEVVAPFGPVGEMVGGGAPASVSGGQTAGSSRPVLPPGVPEVFVPRRGVAPAGAKLVYHPAFIGSAKVWFSDTKAGVDARQSVVLLAQAAGGLGGVDWDRAERVELAPADLERTPATNAAFDELPDGASVAKSYAAWGKQFADTVFRTATLEVLRDGATGLVSQAGESEGAFKARLSQAGRERRDAALAELQEKYGPKVRAVQEKIRKAEQKLEVQKAQAKEAQFGTVLSAGAAVLGGLFGRGGFGSGSISKAATAARGVGRSVRESGDVTRAEEDLSTLHAQMDDLKSQFDADAAALETGGEVTTVTVRPKKTGVTVEGVWLAWVPRWVDASGVVTEAWK